MADAQPITSRLPLRAQHVDATRRSVLEGVSRLLLNVSPDEISFAAVAAESQVSVRTVYRHFPNKEALLDSHWRYIMEEIGAHRVPESTADLLALIPELFEGYHRRARLIRAYLVPRQGREEQRANLPKIRQSLTKIAQHESSSLDETEARWAAAVINSLFCVRGWVTLNEDFDMDGDEASQATIWATNLILEALKHGIHKT